MFISFCYSRVINQVLMRVLVWPLQEGPVFSQGQTGVMGSIHKVKGLQRSLRPVCQWYLQSCILPSKLAGLA